MVLENTWSRPFVRAGPIVVRLVSGLADFLPAFRELILKRARKAHSPAPGGDLVDPLTDRELVILSYLPSRFTNTELAEQCYVSVNTIKSHMAHIYRKLDVANRNGAIARAQEIGLL
jgi:LuxR family maltose regulon positive regulatory protein